MIALEMLESIWNWYAPKEWGAPVVTPEDFLKQVKFRDRDDNSCGFGITLKDLATEIVKLKNK